MSKVLEIVYPDGHRENYNAKGTRNATSLAFALARKAGLDVKKTRWQFRGPLGLLHPKALMKDVELVPGESLELEGVAR